MKTYEQLMKHYWGVIVPMAEAAGINPWECVRWIYKLNTHPIFNNDPSKYTFALTVLEKRPVFVGDKIYYKADGALITVGAGGIVIEGSWTWTPPTKKRTFMLGDKELPCPIKTDEGFPVVIGSRVFYYDNAGDPHLVKKTIGDILKQARDKE